MQQKFNPKNRNLIVNVNGQLIHRDKAGVSPFDSAVQGGDAVWEGLRLYDRRIFKLHEHFDRLEKSARALSFIDLPPREQDARRSPHPADFEPRREAYFRNGPAIESKRRDPNHSGGAQGASLFEG